MEAPERWPADPHGFRRYVFPGPYPFTLIYRLRQSLEIVAVAHQKRRPEYWQDR
jgi:hypothetical protein